MRDVYGAHSRLLICTSTSTVIQNLKSQFPELYKREFKNEINFGDMVIIPVYSYFKIAILNVEDDKGVHDDVLKVLMNETQSICADYKITDVTYADDFPQDWRCVFG